MRRYRSARFVITSDWSCSASSGCSRGSESNSASGDPDGDDIGLRARGRKDLPPAVEGQNPDEVACFQCADRHFSIAFHTL